MHVAALRFYAGQPEAAEAALVALLEADPRSAYRKQKCAGRAYRVLLDGLEARCRFEPAAAQSAAGEQPGADEPREVAVVLSVRLRHEGVLSRAGASDDDATSEDASSADE